jgi:hypothetical protein
MLDYQDATNVDKKGLPFTVNFNLYSNHVLSGYLNLNLGPYGVRD